MWYLSIIENNCRGEADTPFVIDRGPGHTGELHYENEIRRTRPSLNFFFNRIRPVDLST